MVDPPGPRSAGGWGRKPGRALKLVSETWFCPPPPLLFKTKTCGRLSPRLVRVRFLYSRERCFWGALALPGASGGVRSLPGCRTREQCFPRTCPVRSGGFGCPGTGSGRGAARPPPCRGQHSLWATVGVASSTSHVVTACPSPSGRRQYHWDLKRTVSLSARLS